MRRYRIVVQGEFGDLLKSAFAELHIATGTGETVLIAEVDNSTGLYRIIDRLNDFAVSIIGFREIEATSA